MNIHGGFLATAYLFVAVGTATMLFHVHQVGCPERTLPPIAYILVGAGWPAGHAFSAGAWLAGIDHFGCPAGTEAAE